MKRVLLVIVAVCAVSLFGDWVFYMDEDGDTRSAFVLEPTLPSYNPPPAPTKSNEPDIWDVISTRRYEDAFRYEYTSPPSTSVPDSTREDRIRKYIIADRHEREMARIRKMKEEAGEKIDDDDGKVKKGSLQELLIRKYYESADEEGKKEWESCHPWLLDD